MSHESEPESADDGYHCAEAVLAVRLSLGTHTGDPVKRGARLYLVKWQGYPQSEASWEKCKHLSSALLAEARLLEVQEVPEPQSPNAEKRARVPATSPESKLTPDKKR